MLKNQSAKVSEQAASSTVDLAKLQKAFQNIYVTMDEIDSFKVKALANMEQTINALSAEIDKSRAYINRVRAQGELGSGEGVAGELPAG
jgi:uncharacterized protein YaaN involved in tellurite resistance